jgi:hypothetical protein
VAEECADRRVNYTLAGIWVAVYIESRQNFRISVFTTKRRDNIEAVEENRH